MELTQIRFFLSLAQTLNFTRASELCHVTQPALTRSIQRLEAELGGPLLLRERGHTQLTPLGQAMLPLLQQTFDAAEGARRAAKRFDHQALARLRLGLGPHVEPALIAPLIREVNRHMPDLQVTMRQGSAAVLNDWLLASRLDIVLTEDAGRLTDRAHKWQIYTDPVVAVFPDDHELAGDTPLAAAQLVPMSLIGRVDAEAASAAAEAGLEEIYALASSIRHCGDSEAHVCALVQAMHGVALSTQRRRLPAGLRSRRLDPHHTIPVWIAALAGRPMSRAARSFLQLARARDWDD